MPANWRFQTNQIANVAIEVLRRPAEGERGGDFCDVVDLADGRVTVLLGTAPDGGESAAIIADDLCYLLRRSLHRSTPLVRAISELDRHVSQMGVIGIHASALVIMVDALSGSALMVNAGHPPALLLGHDGGIRFVDAPPDSQIGTHRERVTVSLSLSSDSSLVAFTNGLIEREPGLLPSSEPRLLREVAHQLDEPVGVLSLTRGIVGRIGQPSDDATIISIRTGPTASLLTSAEELQEVV